MSAPMGWLLHFATHPWHAQRNCYVCIQHQPSTSYSSLMRRYYRSSVQFLQNDRVYLPKKQEIAADRLLRRLHVQPSASHSWCHVAVGMYIVHSWYLWNPVWKWKARATVMSCMLSSNMLPEIHQIAGEQFIFQQNNAPAHRARDTVEFLRLSTPQFIAPDLWPHNIMNNEKK